LITLVPAKAAPVLQFNAPKAGFKTVDGDLSDWETAPFIGPVPFTIPKGDPNGQLVFFEVCTPCVATASWTGPNDQTSVFSFAWEKDAIYIGAVVTDEYHEHSATDAWNGDALQVLFTDSARTTVNQLYNYALGGVEGALGNIIINDEQGPGGTQAAIVRTGSNTTYEIKIPPSALALTEFTEGQQLGIALVFNDGDQDSPGQGGWSGFGVHAITFGKTASEAGLVTLTEGEPRPHITLTPHADGSVTMTWTNGGTLESADDLKGPYTTTGNSTGTATFTKAELGSRKFYRVSR
jgi:hypothetical protein